MVAPHSELGRLVLEFEVVLEVVLRSSTHPPFMTINFLDGEGSDRNSLNGTVEVRDRESRAEKHIIECLEVRDVGRGGFGVLFHPT